MTFTSAPTYHEAPPAGENGATSSVNNSPVFHTSRLGPPKVGASAHHPPTVDHRFVYTPVFSTHQHTSFSPPAGTGADHYTAARSHPQKTIAKGTRLVFFFTRRARRSSGLGTGEPYPASRNSMQLVYVTIARCSDAHSAHQYDCAFGKLAVVATGECRFFSGSNRCASSSVHHPWDSKPTSVETSLRFIEIASNEHTVTSPRLSQTVNAATYRRRAPPRKASRHHNSKRLIITCRAKFREHFSQPAPVLTS